MTIETQSVSIGIPQYYNPNNEIKVIGALISILQNKTHLFQDERHKTKIWISSKEITRYINDRYSYIIRKNKKSINRRYDNKALSLFDKRLSEKNLETTYGIDLRTVQRHLTSLKKEGLVEENKRKYTPSKKLFSLIHHSPFHFSEEILTAIMKLHIPSQNSLEKNMNDLITLFGTYIIACLLEISRPIEDFFFTNKKLKPLTIEEKNEFTELYLENIIDTKLMYKYFLETFLNQPDSDYERNLKKIQFTKKRNNGKDVTDNNSSSIQTKKVPIRKSSLMYGHSTSLNTNSESCYELNTQSFKMVRETFTTINPEIARQLNSVVSWNVGFGEKANIIYSWISKDN